jgi:hypothetical protein
MDGAAWTRTGLLDVLIPCPFFSTSDFDIPVEEWRDRIGDRASRVLILPGFEHNSRPWNGWGPRHGVANDIAAARGFAASAWARGADGVYLFNWMDCQTRPVSAEDYAAILRDGLGRDAACRLPRRHPACYHDTVPAHVPDGAQLPIAAPAGGRVRVHIGSKPTRGTAVAVFGLTGIDTPDAARFAVRVNGHPAAPGQWSDDVRSIGGAATRTLSVPCPPTALRDGYNILAIRQEHGPDNARVVWAEIAIAPQN